MKNLVTLSLLVIAFGCDTVHNDVDPKSAKTLHVVVYNNRPTVVDLQTIFPGFTNATLANQSGINYFSDRYIGYTPGSATPGQFALTVTNADKTKTLANVVASGQVAQNCSDAAPFTSAQISNAETLSVNLLNNPEFCGFDPYSSTTLGISGSQPGVDVNQNSDGLNIVICACAPEGNTAILTYVPPKDFVGQVKFTYYLGVGGYDGSSPNYFTAAGHDYFSKHDVVIDVTAQ